MNPSSAPARRNLGSVSIRRQCSIECFGMLHHPLISRERQKAGGGPPKHLGGGFQLTMNGPSNRDRLWGCAQLQPWLWKRCGHACADPIQSGALSIPLGKALNMLSWLEQGLVSKRIQAWDGCTFTAGLFSGTH